MDRDLECPSFNDERGETERPRRHLSRERAQAIRAKQQPYERGATLSGLGARQRRILDYVRAHPGCTGKEVDDATNALVGTAEHAHYVTYDAINRLIKRGLLRGEREAFRKRLYVAGLIVNDEVQV